MDMATATRVVANAAITRRPRVSWRRPGGFAVVVLAAVAALLLPAPDARSQLGFTPPNAHIRELTTIGFRHSGEPAANAASQTLCGGRLADKTEDATCYAGPESQIDNIVVIFDRPMNMSTTPDVYGVRSGTTDSQPCVWIHSKRCDVQEPITVRDNRVFNSRRLYIHIDRVLAAGDTRQNGYIINLQLAPLRYFVDTPGEYLSATAATTGGGDIPRFPLGRFLGIGDSAQFTLTFSKNMNVLDDPLVRIRLGGDAPSPGHIGGSWTSPTTFLTDSFTFPEEQIIGDEPIGAKLLDLSVHDYSGLSGGAGRNTPDNTETSSVRLIGGTRRIFADTKRPIRTSSHVRDVSGARLTSDTATISVGGTFSFAFDFMERMDTGRIPLIELLVGGVRRASTHDNPNDRGEWPQLFTGSALLYKDYASPEFTVGQGWGEGALAFRLPTAQNQAADISGNQITMLTVPARDNNGRSVRIDAVAPVVREAKETATHCSPADAARCILSAVSAGTISFAVRYSEAMRTDSIPAAKIMTANGVLIDFPAGGEWSADGTAFQTTTLTVQPTWADGALSLVLPDHPDASGNPGGAGTYAPTPRPVIIDNTPPAITAVTARNYSTWTSVSDGGQTSLYGQVGDTVSFNISFNEAMDARSPTTHTTPADTREPPRPIILTLSTDGSDATVTRTISSPNWNDAGTILRTRLFSIDSNWPEGVLSVSAAPVSDISGNFAARQTVQARGANGELLIIDSRNEAPVSHNVRVSLTEDQERVFTPADFPFSDPDVADEFVSVQLVALPPPEFGVIVPSVSAGSRIFVRDISSGGVKFAPARNANGEARLSFQVRDGRGGRSRLRVLTLDIQPVNDPPVTRNTDITINEDESYVFTLDDFPFDDPEDAELTTVMLPPIGLYNVNGQRNSPNQIITRQQIENGEITYPVRPNRFTGDHFRQSDGAIVHLRSGRLPYRVVDSGTPPLTSGEGIQTIAITEVNDPPAAADNTIRIDSPDDAARHVFAIADFGFSDDADRSVPPRGDFLQTVIIHALPSRGTLTHNGSAVSISDRLAATDIAGDGLVYAAPSRQGGVAYDSFTFTVLDNRDGESDADPNTAGNQPNTITFDVHLPPRFSPGQQFSVEENSAPGTAVGTMQVSHPGGGVLDFSVAGGSGQALFSIDPATGELSVADSAALDHETTDSYMMTLLVENIRGMTDSTGITIAIGDINEAPIIEDQMLSVDENAVGAPVGMVEASDPDGDALAFSIAEGSGQGLFTIDSETGALNVADDIALDHEAEDGYTLTVQVMDPGGLTASTGIIVMVGDVNEAPGMEDQTLSVDEDASVGYVIGMVDASDPDEGDVLTVTIVGDAQVPFAINDETGMLSVAAVLDYETQDQYVFMVQVEDAGGLAVSAGITVMVGNVNEAPGIAAQTFSVDEDAVAGKVIGIVNASDLDEGDMLTFTIAGDAQVPFAINDETGMLSVAAALDRETQDQYVFMVQVEDAGGLMASAGITVTVGNINEAPGIATQTFSVAEDASVGYVIGTVDASDPDEGDVLTFTIVGDAQVPFAIDDETGMLSVAAVLDHETQDQYVFMVQVEDAGGLAASAGITVMIGNANEAPGIAAQTFSVDEDAVAGKVIGIVNASDPDEDDTLTFTIVGDEQVPFAIDGQTGNLSVTAVLDHETQDQYVFMVQVEDAGGLMVSAGVTVAVENINEAPGIAAQTFSVDEDASVGKVIGTVDASDPDEGDVLTFTIAGNGQVPFAINDETGMLSVAAVLDRETQDQYVFMVQVEDAGGLMASAGITVTVGNVNEAPGVAAQTFSVDEDASVGKVIGTVDASDPDEGDMLTFTIAGDAQVPFAIDGQTGNLSVAAALDRETQDQYVFMVQVRDVDGLTASAGITVMVGNINEAPDIAAQTFEVDEDASVGYVIGMVDASDPDEGDVLTFTIAGDAQVPFAIDGQTGNLSVAAALDRETQDQYVFMVQVEDAGGLAASAGITVMIGNVNEAPGIAAQTFSVNEDASVGYVIGTVDASDPDEGDVLTFTIVGDAQVPFAINNETGMLSVAAALDRETQDQYVFMVQVEDAGGLMASAGITVMVGNINEAPDIAAQTFEVDEDASVGYVIGMVDASDPDEGDLLTFTIVGDAQVPFAINNETGMVSVAAALDRETQDQYVFMVQVEDAGGLMASAGITVTVGNINEAPGIAAQIFSVDEDASVGYVIGTVDASDPDEGDVLTFTIANDKQVPFAIDGQTGNLNVAAVLDRETQDQYVFMVQVEDAGGLMASAGITVMVGNINEAPNIATQTFSVDEDAAIGHVIGTVEASDPDNDRLTFAIVGGDGRALFSVDSETGRLSVAATLNYEDQEQYVLIMQVTDQGGLTASAWITVAVEDVNEAPSVSQNPLITIQQDSSHQFSPTEFNFQDAPGESGHLASVAIQTVPTAGGLHQNGSLITAQQLPITISAANLNGLTFTPDSGGSGSPYAAFTFTLADDGGAVSPEASMTINVIPDEPPPPPPPPPPEPPPPPPPPPEPLPLITISASNAAEDGPLNGAFIVSLDAGGRTAVVIRAAIGGTASAGTDYAPLPTTATIPAGETRMTLPVSIIDDQEYETDETVTMRIMEASGARIGSPDAAVVTIADNDIRQDIRQTRRRALTHIAHIVAEEHVGMMMSLTRARRENADATIGEAAGASLTLPEKPGNIDEFIAGLRPAVARDSDDGSRLSVWGRGIFRRLSGDPLSGDATIHYRGPLRGAGLGIDHATRRSLAGVAVTITRTRLDTDLSGDDENGFYRENMAILAPHVSLFPTPEIRLWAAAGLGRGRITDFDGTGTAAADSRLWFAGAGFERLLNRNPDSPGDTQVELGASLLTLWRNSDPFIYDNGMRIDGIYNRITRIDASATLSKSFIAGSVMRLRPFAGLTAARDIATAWPGARGALNLRTGMDVSHDRWTVAFAASTEVIRKRQRSSGMSLDLQFRPPENGVGSALSVSAGMDSSDVDVPPAIRINARHGFALGGARLTPYGRTSLGGDADHGIGWRFSPADDRIELSLEAARKEDSGGGGQNIIMLRVALSDW